MSERISIRSTDGAGLGGVPHGGHLLAWTTPDGVERLFLSAASEYGEGRAIRGGVPVVFPQFSGFGPLPKHGLVRTRVWRVLEAERDAGGRAVLRFALEDDADTRVRWPHRFACELAARAAGDELVLEFAVSNTGETPFTFAAALHTYLCVTDIGAAALHGLDGCGYRDTAAGGGERLGEPGPLRFEGEVDRIYPALAAPVELDTGCGRLAIGQHGFADLVVWNPGEARAAGLADLEPDGWRRFVCVEAARIVDPVELVPGARWSGVQRLRVLG